ncbi:hypothetical protein [Methylocystis parvus]|uniref:hypothetical protein n=1 Tax=Methylocystis parvus TaxID=134 RepID=UPI003C71BAA8
MIKTLSRALVALFVFASLAQAGEETTARQAYGLAAAAKRRLVLLTDDVGVDSTGAANSDAGINRLLAGGNVYIAAPCGTFLIASTVKIASSAFIDGRGECTVFKVSSAMSGAASNYRAVLAPTFGGAVFENADWINGNSGISLAHFQIDASALLPQKMHVIAFYKSSGLTVDGLTIKGRDNADSNTYTGVALINSSSYFVTHNRTSALVTAIGSWDGSKYGWIYANDIAGGSTAKAQNGVVVNAIATNYAVNTSDNIHVLSNSIHDFPASVATAIDLTGLCYSGDNLPCASGAGPFSYGVLNDSEATGNTISNFGGQGIRAGEGARLDVLQNKIIGTGNHAITVRSGRAGPSIGVRVADNTIENANMNSHLNIDAISIGNNSFDAPLNTVVKDNNITGSKHRYPVSVNSGAVGTIVSGGVWDAGTAGEFNNVGTATQSEYKVSWLPDLRFGGAAAGMTYASRSGWYRRTGLKMTYVCGNFTLLSKGTSTGPATINGLPFTSSSDDQVLPISKHSNLITPPEPAPFSVVTSSTAFIKLFVNGAQSVNITNTTFNDTSGLSFCGPLALQ